MLKIYLAPLVATVITYADGFCANLYSVSNGNWSSTTVWSYTAGGSSCGCSPVASDNVTINHSINMDKHLTNVGSSLNGITGILTINFGASLLGGSTYDLDIRSTGQLNLCGTLTARDVTFSNGSIINVCSTGNLIISRDFFNKNNSNSITIDGTMTVGGTYENGNGGIIAGTGTINITNGPVINTGSTYGCEGYDPCNNTFPCQVISPCLLPLPVSFIGLHARWHEYNTVLVTWTTASEVNNDYFEVMHSIDGSTFYTAGAVQGNGTTSQTHSYSFIDKEIPPMQQVLYYRIRQVDYDGHYSFSSVVAVTRNTDQFLVSVFPNPVGRDRESVNITLQNVSAADFVLTDVTGKLILSHTEKDLSTYALVKLPLPVLAQGVYLLKILADENRLSVKLVVCN